eukprot:365126-Chlamydomonas_euryale.AAC.24
MQLLRSQSLHGCLGYCSSGRVPHATRHVCRLVCLLIGRESLASWSLQRTESGTAASASATAPIAALRPATQTSVSGTRGVRRFPGSPMLCCPGLPTQQAWQPQHAVFFAAAAAAAASAAAALGVAEIQVVAADADGAGGAAGSDAVASGKATDVRFSQHPVARYWQARCRLASRAACMLPSGAASSQNLPPLPDHQNDRARPRLCLRRGRPIRYPSQPPAPEEVARRGHGKAPRACAHLPEYCLGCCWTGRVAHRTVSPCCQHVRQARCGIRGRAYVPAPPDGPSRHVARRRLKAKPYRTWRPLGGLGWLAPRPRDPAAPSRANPHPEKEPRPQHPFQRSPHSAEPTPGRMEAQVSPVGR